MKRLFVVLMAALLLGALALAPAVASGKKPKFFPPNSHPYGKSYPEWHAKWFKWFVETPASINPLFDETGAQCNVGQRGRVWFSAATLELHSTRSCTIPAGKALYLFAVTSECSNVEPPPFFGDSEADLRACAMVNFDEVFPFLPVITVDGVEVPKIGRYRMQTPLFGFRLPDDNILGLPPGTIATKAIAESIAVIVKPLSPGLHRVVIAVDSPAFGGPGSTTYDLTVLGKREHDDDDDD